MRKVLFLMGAMLALCVGQANAQRCLPGMRGIQLTGGTVGGVDFKKAFHAGVTLSTYNKRGDKWVFGAEYLQKQFDYKTGSLPMAQFTAEGGYYYTFLSDPSKTLFFSIGGSALAGYETSNWGNKQLMDGSSLLNKDGFLYGGAITFEIETYLADRVVLLVNVRERVLWGTSFNRFNTQIGLGVKFIIN